MGGRRAVAPAARGGEAPIAPEASSPRIRRPNAGKRWTAEDEAELRRLAGEGVPTREIAARLGRTAEGVSRQAEKLGVSLRAGGLPPAGPS